MLSSQSSSDIARLVPDAVPIVLAQLAQQLVKSLVVRPVQFVQRCVYFLRHAIVDVLPRGIDDDGGGSDARGVGPRDDDDDDPCIVSRCAYDVCRAFLLPIVMCAICSNHGDGAVCGQTAQQS